MKIKGRQERKTLKSQEITKHYSKLKNLDERLEEWVYKAFITRELGYKYLHIDGLLGLSMSIPKLARISGCSRTPINTWIKKMVVAGYIERRWKSGYQRFKDCQIIILTNKGREFIKLKFRNPGENLSRGNKKIFSQKNLDGKSSNEIYQPTVNIFNINNKSTFAAIQPKVRTFRRYNDSICANGWRIFEEITGKHQRITQRGMQFLHRAINELSKGMNQESTEHKLDVLRQFIRNQCLYLKVKTLFNIFNLKAIKIFIKQKWRQIYQWEEKAAQTATNWIEEVNRAATTGSNAVGDIAQSILVGFDNQTILEDNSKEKQIFNMMEDEINTEYQKRKREYTEKPFWEGINIEDRKRELLDAYNEKYDSVKEKFANPLPVKQQQPKITTPDDLEAAKLRYTQLLENLI